MSLLSVKTQNTIVILVSHTNLVTKPYFSSGASRALIHSAVRPLRNGSAPTHAAPSRAPDARRTGPRARGRIQADSLHTIIQIHTQTQARRASSKLLFHTCCVHGHSCSTDSQTNTALHTNICIYISPLPPPTPVPTRQAHLRLRR